MNHEQISRNGKPGKLTEHAHELASRASWILEICQKIGETGSEMADKLFSSGISTSDLEKLSQKPPRQIRNELEKLGIL